MVIKRWTIRAPFTNMDKRSHPWFHVGCNYSSMPLQTYFSRFLFVEDKAWMSNTSHHLHGCNHLYMLIWLIFVNSLWSSDVIWRHTSGPTLAQVRAGVKYVLSNTNTNTKIWIFQIQIQIQIFSSTLIQIQIQIQIHRFKYKYKYKYIQPNTSAETVQDQK